jgi:dihydrofolate reductase
MRFINDLKDQPGSDIMVTGGSRLGQTFSRLGLIEEYRFFVYPVVSKGESWFDQIQDKRELELISATPYQNGIVGLYYRPK